MPGTASGRGTWSFAVVPCLSEKKDFFGLLCIDNPQRHIGRLALPEALAPYLVELHKRVLKERFDYVSLTDVRPNLIRTLSGCREALARFTSDRYLSLGVLIISAPQILTLVHTHGAEHVSGLLHYIDDVLRRSFGNSVLLHLYDSEYVVLSANIMKEAFFERVGWVQNLCRRHYSDQIVHGATWARGIFSAQELLREARLIMLSQGARTNFAIPQNLQSPFPPAITSSAVRDFTVYFQPKFDLRTETICGAEALVRGIDERGNPVTPANFIELLEKDGTLRELDLFVLSRVLWQMNRWRTQGRKLLPVSVNFSRFTVFDHSTFGAVLAILSHYEEIDPMLIQIELTETACAVNEETLERTLSPYLGLGLRFALDDFGTGYSNLSIFSKMHFETIKLDRSLIQDLASNPVSRSLLESIVQISHEQNMQVVAEGVETRLQANILQDKNCFFAQGNLFERPLSAEAFAKKYLPIETPAPSL